MIERFSQFHRDARILLGATLVTGAALSLYWIDFNLYLASLGHSPATIGLVATAGSLAGALAAFPASALSDRIGRRAVMLGGIAVALAAIAGLLLVDALPVIALSAVAWSIGQQSLQVVQAPFMAEHSDADHRNELFALQAALFSVTSVIAAALGGVVATAIGAELGLEAGSPGVYRIILVIMAGLLIVGLGIVALLRRDRPAPSEAPGSRARVRLGVSVGHRALFVRLLLPGFLIAIGAGQVIPFLNLFVQARFGLDLAELNALFAVTSLGTVIALLAQPALARRFGQITSVVMVQGASIPFLVVLGFSPVLWTVVGAMVVRNSLMNAGNPIFSAFAMEQVSSGERATLAAAMSVLWQVGWVIGGAWYALLQATIGFEAGYTVNFVTIVVLYSIATTLYWTWFRDVDRQSLAERAAVS
jgi:MFS family permease